MAPNLPNEIFILICENIKKRSDKLNLIISCRLFYKLLLPELYRVIPIQCICGRTPKPFDSTFSFTQTILRRPDLARAVRCLYIDVCGEAYCFEPAELGPLDYDKILIKDALAMVSETTEEAEEWEVELADGSIDAWIALSLPFLSRLRSLHFAPYAGLTFINRTLARAAQGLEPFELTPVLTSLEEIYIWQCISDIVSPTVDDILPWFDFPSLKKISGNGVLETGELPIPEGDSSVTELELYASRCGLGMKALIESCQGLKSFKYTHAFPVDNHEPFADSLVHAKDTLEELWLDYFDFKEPQGPVTQNHWIGSLKGFKQLRKLHVRFDNLFTKDPFGEPNQMLAELLPPSIELLSITECIDLQACFAVEQLDILVKDRDTVVPYIKQIQVFAAYTMPVDTDEWEFLSSLKHGCKEGDIEFELREFRRDREDKDRNDAYDEVDSFWVQDYYHAWDYCLYVMPWLR
ncbi:hypothetical protein PHISCL_03460 [Aspergillus sclerotialis]|uniref:Leucine-rich repeat domain-containing protein n=1 Tax=Aspergillus sclerotialis TaxID=2070753 RepID=A0A3A2ZPM1_9EURO|nr:hypothetical protein PHISCL_03460 [Aspergillus sclerotialis]